MDVGPALRLLAADATLTSNCPLAQFARALAAGAGGQDGNDNNASPLSAAEAAALLLKSATAESEDATLKVDQCEIARHKLKAELARVEALAADAEAQRRRATMTADFCRAILASQHELHTAAGASARPDQGPAPNRAADIVPPAQRVQQPAAPPSQSTVHAETARDVPRHREETLLGSQHHDPTAVTNGVTLQPSRTAHEPQGQPHPQQAQQVALDDGRSDPLRHASSPLDAVITALTAAVEVKEARMLEALADLEDDVRQRVHNPWSADTYADWVLAAELLWKYVPRPPPPLQVLVLAILRSLLERSANAGAPDGQPHLIPEAIAQGAVAVLARLSQSVNEDLKAEALGLLAFLAASGAEPREALVASRDLAASLVSTVANSNNEVVLERALLTTWNLATSDRGKEVLLAEGALNAILTLLFTDSHAVLDNVAMALAHITRLPQAKAALGEGTGVEQLVALLLHPAPTIRSKVAAAVWNCGALPANRTVMLRVGAVPLLSELLTDSLAQENAAGALWNLAMEEKGKQQILEYGGVERLVGLLSSPTDAVVENAVGCLWNCSATQENRAAMRRLGALPPLVSHLRNPRPEIRENAAGALRNLVINDHNKVAFREAGGIDLIVDDMDTASTTLLEKWLSTLWILTVTPENKHALRVSRGLPKIVALLDRSDLPQGVREKALGTLKNCATVPEGLRALTELNIVAATVRCAQSIGALTRPRPTCSPQARESIASLLSHVVRDDRVAAARAGALDVIVAMLDDPARDTVVEHVVAALANLMSTTAENKALLHNTNVLGTLASILAEARDQQLLSLLHASLCALKHTTTMDDGNLRAAMAQPGIVELLVELVQRPPTSANAVVHAEDTAREAVFCLRNFAASTMGAHMVIRCNGEAALGRVAQTAQSETLRKGADVVLRLLHQHKQQAPAGGAR